MVTLGFLTLNRYDLLEKAIISAEAGSMRPERYFVVDNGGQFRPTDFYNTLGNRLQVAQFGRNIGVAAGWNVIIKSTPEIRIISNDDVTFFDDTIETLVDAFSTDRIVYPGGIPSANSFSCFLIPDAVVEKVGLFDERISPNYGYFEDNDYYRRMVIAGIPLIGIPECRLGHFLSSTIKRFSDKERNQHNEKFKIAQNNYIRKWGGKPGEERYSNPQGI